MVMDNVPKTEKRWRTAGEILLWMVYLFWAVWLINAFLPPKPEQTLFEVYMGKQMSGHLGDQTGDEPATRAPRNRLERLNAGGGQN